MNRRRRQTRLMLVALGALLVALLAPAVQAQDTPRNLEAQRQVDTVLVSLRDSEAETAAGSYVPGSGAFFAIELIHGPNSAVGDFPYRGVRDWGMYLMSTFGGALTAVADDEVVALTIRYYDYIDGTFHSLTLVSPARATAQPDQTTVWLDGALYDEDAARQTESDHGGDVPTPIPTSSTVLVFETPPTPVPTSPATPDVEATAPATPAATNLPGEPITFDSVDSVASWLPIGGTWVWSDGAYEQTELNRFDLISYFGIPVSSLTRLAIDLRFVDGQMGAGFVFAAPDSQSKNNAQMVSFAANGTFLQWGYYDDAGVFQYQGGIAVDPGTADQAWHALAVTISGNTYAITLDGVQVGQGVPLIHGADGYAGLLSSTSDTQFDNVTIEAGS